AVILKDPATDIAALIRRANQRLEAHQQIRDWSIWPHDEFPRTPSTQKIKHGEIARELVSRKAVVEENPTAPDLSAMSPLERIELLSELENKYQVELDEDAFAKLNSTGELEEWLQASEALAVPPDNEPALSEWARSMPVRWFRTIFQTFIARPLY